MTKATHRKTTVDVIKEQRKAAKKQFGLCRQSASGINAASSSIGALSQLNQGGSAGDNQSTFLRTSGDTMVGPFAMWRGSQLFFPTSGNDNTLDLSIDGAYTSHWIWAVGGGSNQLEEIQNASFNGQLLFIESTATQTQTIKDESASGLVASSPNIKTLDGNDLVLGTDKTIVLFMFTDIDNMWHQVSSPGGINLLSSTNTWTGGNTWTGSVGFAGASTSITSPNIYIGDATSDTVNILGNIASTGVNTWTGINTFASPTSFSVTSPNIYIGDEATDTINITGTASHQGDIDMNTWDIFAVDRVKFSQTEGSGDALTSTDTGIEAIYTSGNPYGMSIRIPTANYAIFQIVRGSTEMLNISALGIIMGDEMNMNSNKITGLATPTSDYDASTKKYVDDNAGGSGANTALSNLSSVSVNTGFDMNNNNITDCGQVDCTAITDTGTLMVDGTTYLNGAVSLGNAAGDDINLNGKLDVNNNYTTTTVAFSGLYAVGYIEIEVGSATKRLYYGAG